MNADVAISGNRKAISNWFRRFGTEIFPISGKYRLKESLFGIFKWHKELTLPPIDYVLLFKHVFAKCEACSIDERENNIHAYFQVSLVHHKNKRIVVHESKNKQEAFALANALAKELNVGLRDSSAKRP